MSARPRLSLIVPTRARPDRLHTFLASVWATVARPARIEVVLVVDHNDAQSLAFPLDRPNVRRIAGPPGRTMGELNRAGCAAASGDYFMLLNDDVVVRTPGWDVRLLAYMHRFPDGVALAHVNDTYFRDRLCIFPLVSRTYCELAGGVCPPEYHRYRIDDHIEDVFNLLRFLGPRRVRYFPDVVFEHANTVVGPHGQMVYQSDPDILARDAPLFESLAPSRKELALQLFSRTIPAPTASDLAHAWKRLQSAPDPFSLRVPGRQRIDWSPRWRLAFTNLLGSNSPAARVRRLVASDGCTALARKALTKIIGLPPSPPAALQPQETLTHFAATS